MSVSAHTIIVSKMQCTVLCVVVVSLFHHGVAATTIDSTLVPEAKGAAVVESTVSRIQASCVFKQQERKFARRSAYVESSDGLDIKTFRSGYHGGIWQVDKGYYRMTKTKSSYLDAEISNIKQQFGITWTATTWQDLRKPLYSGLAFRLYVTYESRKAEIPWEIPDQANYWKGYYRPNLDAFLYTNRSSTLEKGCNTTVGPDLVFVLDASGSIGSANFELVRQFAVNVVNAFQIGPKDTQVGVIKFSPMTVDFYLNRYTTKQDVVKHIRSTVYTSGGTGTDVALTELVQKVMTPAYGARVDRPRVAIVITDGSSNSRSKTIKAAKQAHNASITMLAVGVGKSLNLIELEAIASPPKCTNQFFPKDFNNIFGVVNSIKTKVCEAPMIVTPSNNGSIIEGKLSPGESQNCRINIPTEGATVNIRANTGSAKYFVASDTYPSDAYYEDVAYALPGKPDSLYISHSNTSELTEVKYCNIKGNETQESNIIMETVSGDTDKCNSNPCRNSGVCTHGVNAYTCTCTAGYQGTNCDTDINDCSPNPCQHQGKCTDGINNYTCTCKTGYEGGDCERDIDDCSPNPCQNSGMCIDMVNNYTCICDAGYQGRNCHIDKDECSPYPCENNGLCIDKVNAYQCICGAGFAGQNCEIDIDDCSPNPCRNNGVCTDGIFSYTCECADGYGGTTCQEICKGDSYPLLGGPCGVSNDSVTASSSLNDKHGSDKARIHDGLKGGKTLHGAWCPSHNRVGDWIQVRFNDVTNVHELRTKGRPDGGYDYQVSKYKISTSLDCEQFTEYSQHGQVKIFSGNVDSDTLVSHKLNTSIAALCLRFVIVERRNYPCMRFEVIGKQACPTGITYYKNACYKFSRYKTTWSGANQVCLQHKMKLLTIDSEEKNRLMENFFSFASAHYSTVSGKSCKGSYVGHLAHHNKTECLKMCRHISVCSAIVTNPQRVECWLNSRCSEDHMEDIDGKETHFLPLRSPDVWINLYRGWNTKEGQEATYYNWAHKRHNPARNCALASPKDGYKWHKTFCFSKHYFICETVYSP